MDSITSASKTRQQYSSSAASSQKDSPSPSREETKLPRTVELFTLQSGSRPSYSLKYATLCAFHVSSFSSTSDWHSSLRRRENEGRVPPRAGFHCTNEAMEAGLDARHRISDAFLAAPTSYMHRCALRIAAVWEFWLPPVPRLS